MGKNGLRGSVLVLALAAGAAGWGCDAESSGACPGIEDGTYFQLQMYNYLPADGVEVRLNNRIIGSIDQPLVDSNDTVLAPGETFFGGFPVCDKNTLEAIGGTFTLKLCATPELLSPGCELARPDFCWASFFVQPPSEPPPANIPADFESPQCYLSQGSMIGSSNGQPVYAYPCQSDWILCN